MNMMTMMIPQCRRRFFSTLHIRLVATVCFILALMRQLTGNQHTMEQYLQDAVGIATSTYNNNSTRDDSPSPFLEPSSSLDLQGIPRLPLTTTAATSAVNGTPAETHTLENHRFPGKRTFEDDLPLVWLLSFPNSGTSYTLTLVERASNRSTATHHGKEVATSEGISIPVSRNTRGGPYWEGLVNARGTVRPLPDDGGYLLTKSHCGSRCANCGLPKYKTSLRQFTRDCQKTTGHWKRQSSGRGLELVTSYVPLHRVAKVVWLMRHPLENIVARYHLERRNWERKAGKDPEAAQLLQHLHKNVTGFRNWCRYLDTTFEEEDPSSTASLLPPDVSWSLWSSIPCRGEFYKYTQWHNLVGQMLEGRHSVLEDRPQMHWYYEDYDNATNPHDETNLPVDTFLRYLDQQRVGPIKEFRTPMPIYRTTHYSTEERRRIWRLIQALASDQTWAYLERYYEDRRIEEN